MPKKKKSEAEQSSNYCQFDIEAIVQESNRLFFHQIGLNIEKDGELFKLTAPAETPYITLGAKVKTELDRASTVMEMKTVTRKKRFEKYGLIGAQPIVSPPKA